jgi:hypothetical protein
MGDYASIHGRLGLLGSVDNNGNIYKAKNLHDSSAEGKPLRLLGSVDECDDLYLAGAAAFLLEESRIFNPPS